MKRITISTLVVLAPLFVRADIISPTHKCVPPAGLSQFASDGDRARHQRQVAVFRQCLVNFIKEQERQISAHTEAARKAGEELNRI